MEDHEFLKFNPEGVNNQNIELLSSNITKEKLPDGREVYSIFFENKIVNIVRIPMDFKFLKNKRPFIKFSVVDKNNKEYQDTTIDNIAIVD